MSTTNISTVIDILTVARDNFKSKYGVAKKQYEEAVKSIKHDFKAGTPRYTEELENAKKRFDGIVEKESQEVKSFAKNNIDELRESEMLKVRMIDTNAMEKLSAVANLPLTASEISILQNRFAPNGEYWATRMIADMAEKNGLKPSQFLHSATLDTKLNVLQQLEEQVDNLTKEYNGEVRYQTEVLLADAVLARAERIYTNGYLDSNMEDEQIARRAFVQLKGKSVAEQGIGLQNILNNTTEETKRALFFEIANNTSGIMIEESALRWSGYADEFEAYQKNEHSEYKQAKNALNQIVVADSKEAVEAVALSMSENAYFSKMLENAGNSNKYVDAYLHPYTGTNETTQTAGEE